MKTRGYSVWLRAGAAVSTIGLVGCEGVLPDSKQTMEIAMLGVFETPSDASGNSDPRYLTLTLEDIKIVLTDGTEIDAYEDEPKELRIVNRSQIIGEADLTDYSKQTMQSIGVYFNSQLSGRGRIEKELAVTLFNPVAELVGNFEIASSQDYRLDIKVQWKNIVLRDTESDPPTETMMPPSFVLELKRK